MNYKNILNGKNLSILLLMLVLALQLTGMINLPNLLKKSQVGGCAGTEFGCCADKKTACAAKDCPNCPLY